MDKSKKYILLGYEGDSIFRLYNLTKKNVIRANDVHIVERKPHFVDPEELTEAHETPFKRQRLAITASAAGEEIKQLDAVVSDVAPVALVVSSSKIRTIKPLPVVRPGPGSQIVHL